MFNWFKTLYESTLGATFDALAWFTDKVLLGFVRLAMSLATWVLDQLPPVFQQLDVASRLNSLFQHDAVALALYLLPLSECAALFTLAFGAAMFIRSLRFIVGWIPTIEG